MLEITGLLLAMVLAAPARAGTLYKCAGADGVRSYVNKPIAGASCAALMNDTSPRRDAVAKNVAARPPSAPAAVEKTVVSAQSAAVSAAIVPAAAPVAHPLPRRVISGQVYIYMQDGVSNYTNVRPRQAASLEGLRTMPYRFIETCYACALNPGVDFASVRLNTTAYAGQITTLAREFGVEEAIVRAIIHAESAYNPVALSRAGAQGLMQLMPATARRFSVSDAYDVAQNLRGGVQYLSWLLKRFNGDLTLAAAGYNAGEVAVDRYGGVPPYSETQRYVQRVGLLAGRYRGALATAH